MLRNHVLTRLLFSTFALAAINLPASAAAINFVNHSSSSASIVNLTSQATGAVTENVLEADLAPQDSVTTSFVAPQDDCVYQLDVTFASDHVINMSDVDLCLTDSIVLE